MSRVLSFLARRRGWLVASLLLAVSCVSAFGFGDGLYDAGWLLLGLSGGLVAVWLGLGIRQAWIFPPILRRAERLWASGAPIAEVLAASAPLAVAVGETGYRAMTLRAWAHFAAGRRGLAVESASRARLARRPLWARPPLRICLKLDARGWKWPEAALRRLAPEIPTVCWPSHRPRQLGWKALLDCVPFAADDPLFLEACMERALERLELNMGGAAPAAGPEARALLELSMTLLVRRHNDPRLPWDRVRLAAYLQRERRFEAVLALCGGLPPAYRPPDLWLMEARTWGQLGDIGSARTTIDAAVRVHPASYPLWMEAYRIAMARKDGATAKRSLDRASGCMGARGGGPDRWEYELAKSEYFY
jgi:hypothetical protein